MSLFRVRDFWSFELNQLSDHEESCISASGESAGAATSAEQTQMAEDIDEAGRYIVPETEQLKTDDQRQQPRTDTRRSSLSSGDLAQRQLLCASQLGLPVVDVKCGHFTSTLKQSIAVLSFDKLIVYQVKRRQVDLLTAPIGADQSSRTSDASGSSAPAIDESLFSHKLEEHHRVDLLKLELASNIIMLNSSNHHIVGATDQPSELPGELQMKESSRNRNKQLQLPQRDLIVVQYHNQFIFTLVDHKKVVGHFSLRASGDQSSDKDVSEDRDEHGATHLEELSKFMGSMPMALSKDYKGLAVVITMSDNRMHYLLMSKLIAMAKQSVVNRVAKDLIKTSDIKRSSLSYDNQNSPSSSNITLNLDLLAEWTLELACAPISIDFIQRHLTNEATPQSNKDISSSSQLLVMSRYYIDLFSSSGAHMWSQRFENPLICVHPYILPLADATKTRDDPQRTQMFASQQDQDRLLSLVCTDCLCADKCNLLVLEEERIAWSALLNSKPMQLWRTNLSKMIGAIATLNSNEARLSISYLGTNLDFQCEQLDSEAEAEGSELDQMCNLDEISASLIGERVEKASGQLERQRKLDVDTSLEAINQWPDVRVNSTIKIRPEVNSTEVIQNIVATLEFDDLIEFQSTDFTILVTISSGVAQMQLGSCWPDRREPISFNGYFSMRSASRSDAWSNSMVDFASKSNQQVQNQSLMPKSLKVKLYLRFNILHSGTLVQEESFMLPLNMVARLAHIDYSSGQNQTLDDIMANLNMYKRQPSILRDDTIISDTPYYLCDFFIKISSGIIDLVDEIIESDLVCRGFNSETANSNLQRPQDRRERDMGTLENINLLAQSLDCRLKYNSLAHSTNKVVRQSSEEHLPAVMMSMALKIPSEAQIIQGLANNQIDSESPFTIVWLHLCDLLPSNNPTLSQEIIKLHLREWKAYEHSDKCSDTFHSVDLNSDKPILISIECDHPMPILFLQNHITERLKRRALIKVDHRFKINALSESMHDAIEINCSEINKMDNFIAISVNLHDCLTCMLKDYDNNIKNEFKRLKNELAREYCKFHVSTMTSLSVSKRLINLPDETHQQFSNLSLLTKQYQLNLIRILSELEKLKKLDYLYSKVSGTSDIIIESREKQPLRWPEFKQFVD